MGTRFAIAVLLVSCSNGNTPTGDAGSDTSLDTTLSDSGNDASSDATDCGSGGATTQVDCSTMAAVSSALDSAASGDTVRCSAPGTYAWASLALPATKNITLDGNGATLTAGAITIPSSATFEARLTGFTFYRYDAVIDTSGDALDNLPWRIDHCTFDANGTDSNPMITTGIGPGLLDHCNFKDIPLAKETIHNTGFADPTALPPLGWITDLVPGSPKALYIEDCTANGAAGNSSCLMQNYYGARTVVRHCTLDGAMVDVHGNNTWPSGRWFELYDNTLGGSSETYCIRGGSGVIYGNTGAATALFVDETASGLYDTGYGTCSPSNAPTSCASYPVYLWDNASIGYAYNVDGCSVHNGNVVVGQDVIQSSSGLYAALPSTCAVNAAYWATDTSTLYKCVTTNNWTPYYTAYTYPHPRQSCP